MYAAKFTPVRTSIHHPTLSDADRRFLDAALDVHATRADVENIAYWPRALLQVTLPHADPGPVPLWGRRSGDYYLSVQPGAYLDAKGNAASYGVPYGALPRLVIAFLARQAKLTKNPRIELGNSLADFMTELGYDFATGGANGSITRVKKQTLSLIHSRTTFGKDSVDMSAGVIAPNIAKEYQLWWSDRDQRQGALFSSYLILSETFFEEMVNHGIPVNMKALRALKSSPLALDLYAWATYRSFGAKNTIAVSWADLARQFGGDYASPKEFARNARHALRKVQTVYPDLNVTTERGRLILGKSHTHIVPRTPK